MKSSIDPNTLLTLKVQDENNSFSALDCPNDIAEYCKLIVEPDFDVDEIPKHLRFVFSALLHNDEYDPHILAGELKRISTAPEGACRSGPSKRWQGVRRISTGSLVFIIIFTVAIVVAFILIAHFGILPASSPSSSDSRYAATRG
jgi:hypothetical protein